MKTYTITWMALVFFAVACNSKDQADTTEDPKGVKVEDVQASENSTNGEDESFTDLTRDLLAAVGIDSEEAEQALDQIDQFEEMVQDSAEVGKWLETLIKDGVEREAIENAEKEASSKRESGDLGDLMEAFKALEKESGLEATIGKLLKADSLTGKNSFALLGIDPEELKKGAQTPNVDLSNLPSMTKEERQLVNGFRKAANNVHSLAEMDEYREMIASVDPEELVEEGKATPSFVKEQRRLVKNSELIFQSKSRTANRVKKKFRDLNPDLFFGDDVGMTYFSGNKAVYLPLGKLSFADEIIDFNHPNSKTNARDVLGEPDAYQVGTIELEKAYSLGVKGTLTVKFEDNALVDVNGPDLFVFEMGAIEPTKLEISQDGENWIEVGKIKGGVAEVDIHDFVGANELYYYVRLTDLDTPSALPGADVDAIAAIGAAMRLNLDSQVLFDTGKAELKPEGKEALLKLVESIQILNSGNVIVEGHTDDVGSNSSNLKLSLARARSVSAELRKHIPSSTFKWKEKGFGEDKPLVENDSEENRAKNRRVEVLILPN